MHVGGGGGTLALIASSVNAGSDRKESEYNVHHRFMWICIAAHPSGKKCGHNIVPDWCTWSVVSSHGSSMHFCFCYLIIVKTL